ncbi:GreA/GreB family elongation factor [Robertkochia aurantiaca]|uniref:GreA/GreB family elongation factor n=1 Tax=Robertkochia aurantiaca TaxID=2873700 RepID=UPI001CCFEC4A|nr:GreA/GreB family elongation factor [Robertkochia sp. 3YJGBD-33]
MTKNELFDSCLALLQKKIRLQEEQIASLRESLQQETKSSAGDKHETGRAMVQLEMERTGERLRLLEADKQLLLKIKQQASSGDADKIGAGSLVHTDRGYYFLALSLGIIDAGEFQVVVVSPGSPLGNAMLGRSVGERIMVNGQGLLIKKIV